MIHPLWYLCISIRLFMTYSLLKYQKYSKYFKYVILVIGLGFGYKALTGSNNEIQIVKVFWHKTRFIHSFFFILAYLMPRLKMSAFVLIFDIIFSIIYRTYLETK